MAYISVGSIDDYYKKALEASKSQYEQSKSNINTMSDEQKKAATDIYNSQIDDTAVAYEDKYRENAVQKLINERDVAENMANLGLTNSGLNRTQQTAVQLSYANNKANIDRQKQAAVDSLAQSLATELSGIETSRLSSLAQLEDSYSQTAMENAQKLRQADLDYNEELKKAEYDYLTKSANQISQQGENIQKNLTDDTNNLYAHLKGNNIDKDYSAKLISAYCQKYDLDPRTDANVLALLSAAGISADDLANYVNTGTTLISNADYVRGNAKGTNIEWNYNTAGAQKYKVKVITDNNGIFGANKKDVINIYYPDGSIVAENVKLSDLSEDIRKKLAKNTKGNEGKTFEISLDLSNEDFRKKGFLEKFASAYKL